jgi:hypothetical protein
MKKKKAASSFIKALRMGNSKKPKLRIINLEEENSIEAANDLFENLLSKYPEAEWVVNITGGTKPMSIGAFEFFKNKTKTMLYVPIVGQSKALNFSNGTSINLDYKLRVREFLAGYGFELAKSELDVIESEKLAVEWFETSCYLTANYDDDSVFGF